ncbi:MULTISPECIES: amidohydrolase family protein [unclassified Helicobacter]|uniref:amidohydrolase family protein n=1 Tax=unclassified Helicobacter TaxID=2593540 RepID=UPI000CF0EF36|nr:MULTISPECIES: amidohydrolase family protein [unclassified Helicobacter]
MLLINGVICDYSGTRESNIRVKDGKIFAIDSKLTPESGEEVIDCKDKVILPALIDIGIYPKNKSLSTQTLKSLSKKCLSGGVGSVLLYADYNPQASTESIIELVELINHTLPQNIFSSIYPLDMQNKIANIASLKTLGARAIHIQSQDLEGQNLLTLTHYANMLDIPFISLPCDRELAYGVVDEGLLATQLGLPSIPSIAWEKEIIKMCCISKNTQARMLLTITDAFEDVLFSNQKGAKITIQTPVHHLVLNEEAYINYATKAKMFPPLKHKDKQQALISRLQNNQIHCLSSLQNATYNSQKDKVFELASCGVDIIHHYFSILYTFLVKENIITLEKLSELTSKNQANFLKIPKGRLEKDYDADLIILDLSSSFKCQDSYSPYFNQTLFGKIEKTILKGKIYE